MLYRLFSLGCAVVLGVVASRCGADQLVLKDGTTLDGTVILQGTSYWVKLTDGTTRLVSTSNVEKHVKADGLTGTLPAKPLKNDGTLAGARRQADAADTTAAAVATWKTFLAAKPTAADATAAQVELDKWLKLAEQHAQRVGAKWLVGEELATFLAKLQKVTAEYLEDARDNKTMQAIKKLQEMRELYPNSFEANFLCGYAALLEHNYADAVPLFETALAMRPGDRPTTSNLGVALFLSKKDMERGLLLLNRVVEDHDTPQSAHNLVRACAMIPETQRNNARLKPAFDAARVMSSKYDAAADPQLRSRGLIFLFMTQPGGAGATTAPAMLASGTGFVVADGVILTNRHVIDGATSLTVLIDGEIKKPAEVIVIDKEDDLALIRVKSDLPLPAVSLSTSVKPNEGAACFVLGFPLIDRMGASLKVTQGIVSGTGRDGTGADVVIDAKVNPGNSGGPLLDKYGRVIGIVTMKTRSATFEDSYGLAIGATRIAQFLVKNGVAVVGAEAGKEALSAEDVVMKVKPSVVCIIARHEK